MKKWPLILLGGLGLCWGCSLKEDRSLCPCMLMLDFSEVDTSTVRSATLILKGKDVIFDDELSADDFRSGMDIPVPRTELALGVWSGTEGMMTDGSLSIPAGEDCPPVFYHTSVLDTDRDILEEKVIMRKNHCRMTVNFEHGDGRGWQISLSGNVDGYLPDGTPSAGKFSCEMRRLGEQTYCSVLPRQSDNSLVMEINDGSNVMKRFAIGEYIADCGYDWNAPDLEDLMVDIDLAVTGLVLTIRGWDRDYKFDIVI